MKKPDFLTPMNIDGIRPYSRERYLPTAFTDDLTLIQKVNQVIEYLYQYSKITVEMVDKWNEVYGWVMNEGLDDMVRYRLDEWLKNGTLHEIINTELFTELNNKIESIGKDVDNKFTDLDKRVDKIDRELTDKFDKEINKLNNLFTQMQKDINNTISDFKSDVNKEIAKKVDTTGYYSELEFSTHRSTEYETTYYIVKIPRTDESGKRIELKHGIASDKFSSVGSETVREFSKRKGATMVANLSPSTSQARIIHNGVILQDTESIDPYRPTLAFDKNGNMRSYPRNVSARTILADGYTEAMTTFFNLINNGSINHTEINGASDTLKNVNPRTVVGRNNSGEIFILVSDGRRSGERGFTAIETARVALAHGMTFAQMLDGGGSSQVTMYHSNINKLSERIGSRTEGYVVGQHERKRSNFLYVGKDVKDDPLTKILSNLGNINKNADDRLSEYENLQRLSTNWIEMGGYLVNGWEQYSGTGANACRAWITPDNMLYLVGNIRRGTLGQPFMKLPPRLRPMFSFSFVVSGREPDTLFRVTTNTDGELTLHALSGERVGRGVGYCKLDGIFFPINPLY